MGTATSTGRKKRREEKRREERRREESKQAFYSYVESQKGGKKLILEKSIEVRLKWTEQTL